MVIEPNSAANSIYIKSGGNVGIGTSVPDALLHIEQSSIAKGVYFNQTGVTNDPVLMVNFSGTTGGSTMENAAILRVSSISNIRPLLSLVPSSGTGVLVTATGKVGIGTESTDYNLTVQGSSHTILNLRRSSSAISHGSVAAFSLLNSATEYFRYGAVAGGIKSNTAGEELGFVSILAANGDGVTDVAFLEEVINVSTEKVNIKDVLRLQPRASAPASPIKGDMYFDNVLNKLRVYDGTTWQACW